MLFSVGALVTVLTLITKRQSIKENAAPATTLLVVPGSQNKSAGDSLPLTIEMNTGSNQSMGFDLVINFNSQIFQVTSISAGSAGSDFSVIKKNIDNNSGKIFYSAFTTDTTKALNGSGLNILVISGMVKSGVAPGTYNFTFDSSTIVIGYQESQNVLMGTTPGSVVVVGSTVSSTPTATATSTGSPTSTPNPTATAAATTTATAIATASSSNSSNSVKSNATASPLPTSLPLPVTGVSLPTIIFGVLGVVGLLISFAIAI